jgi:hypothetical protein
VAFLNPNEAFYHGLLGGSTHQLVMCGLQTKKVSPDELAAVRRLIDELEAKNREDSI